MKSTLALSLGALLVGAAAVGSTGAAASPSSTPESGCHNLLKQEEGPTSGVGATKIVRSARVVSAEAPSHNQLDLHDEEHPKEVDLTKVGLGYETFARGGVVDAVLSLGAPVDECAQATYSLELYDLSRRPVLLDDVRTTGALAESPTAGDGKTDRTKVLLHALIDDADALHTASGSCSNARLVVRDAAGSIVDVEPNTGFHYICTGGGGATSYSG